MSPVPPFLNPFGGGSPYCVFQSLWNVGQLSRDEWWQSSARAKPLLVSLRPSFIHRVSMATARSSSVRKSAVGAEPGTGSWALGVAATTAGAAGAGDRAAVVRSVAGLTGG